MSPYKDGSPTLMEQFDDADAHRALVDEANTLDLRCSTLTIERDTFRTRVETLETALREICNLCPITSRNLAAFQAGVIARRALG